MAGTFEGAVEVTLTGDGRDCEVYIGVMEAGVFADWDAGLEGTDLLGEVGMMLT